MAGSLCILTVVCSLLQAIMESQNNPLAIMNYQDDPDVMLVSAEVDCSSPLRCCCCSAMMLRMRKTWQS